MSVTRLLHSLIQREREMSDLSVRDGAGMGHEAESRVPHLSLKACLHQEDSKLTITAGAVGFSLSAFPLR